MGQQIDIGHAEHANKQYRPTMEDAIYVAKEFCNPSTTYLALFDGHSGKSSARWCSQNLHHIVERKMKEAGESADVQEILSDAFLEADRHLTSANGVYSGTTAVVAIVQSRNVEGREQKILYCANVGDSRAVIKHAGNTKRLSYDHKGSDPMEQSRIRALGGFIRSDYVNGILAVTRALGDSEMKEFIIGHPYTSKFIVEGEEGATLVLACDGVWDVCDDETACNLADRADDSTEAAQTIVSYSIDHESTDNISCIVAKFANGGRNGE